MSASHDARWAVLQTEFLKYLEGDPKATVTVFEGISKALKPFFLTRTHSDTDSEELTQAALLKVHFARDRFDSRLSLKTWVFTIANRCLIDHWRKRDSEQEIFALNSDEQDAHESPELPELSSDGPNHQQLWELNQELNQALEKLKPDDRMIVYLYAVEGLSMAEISESVGLSVGAVKIRAHRSYVKLRESLKGAD